MHLYRWLAYFRANLAITLTQNYSLMGMFLSYLPRVISLKCDYIYNSFHAQHNDSGSTILQPIHN